MKDITMNQVGWKEPKRDSKEAETVSPMHSEEGKIHYPSLRMDKKEFGSIDDFKQDGMYEIRALVRVSGKETGDATRYDGGGNVTLEVQKLGFKPVGGKKSVDEMTDDEMDEEIEKA